MMDTTRRAFLKTCAATATGSLLLPERSFSTRHDSDTGDRKKLFSLGMASYTLREFNVDEAYAMTRRLNLERIALKDFHLPMDSDSSSIRSVSEQAKKAGLDLYGCGVVYMKNEQEVERAFRYASTAGMRVIIGVPEHHLLGLVNEKVQVYDIKLAIHNHGPGDKRYPSALSVYEKIAQLDPRMGLCIDIGHSQRFGENPAEAIRRFGDRLHDLHLKDVSSSTAEGGTVEIGRGVVDIPEVLKALLDIGYSETASFEFEKDSGDPLPGTAESVGYVRGVLTML
jgi:sugar phosphate isomerase/epimerase